MDDNLKFILLSPLNTQELNRRRDEALMLRSNIENVQKTFMEYSNSGKSLCKSIGGLVGSFNAFTNVYSDPTITSISQLMTSFQEIFESAYQRIESTVILPLKAFASTISLVDDVDTKSQEATQNYLTILNKYSNLAVKGKTGFESELPKLKKAQEEAVQANFNLHTILDLIERKKLVEIAGTFLAFIETTASSYRECVYNYDEYKDSFNTLRAALPASSNGIQQFYQSSQRWSVTLEHCLSLYWERFSKPFPGTTSLEYEGFLWKKDRGFKKSWNRRYVTISNNTLTYYNDKENKSGKSIPLLLCTVKYPENIDRKYCIEIISNQGEEVYLSAISEWDRDECMAVIQNNIQNALDNVDSQEPQPQTNITCADCGCNNPTWCSINWGVCICIHCAGVHRSLGADVSKVRSLTLDRLDAKIHQLFGDVGNERANQILEAKCDKHLTPNASKDERISFITKKYTGSFVDSSHHFTPQEIVQAIREDNIMKVYEAIALKQIDPSAIFLAASIGGSSICNLIALNIKDPNILDHGWSAFSYAAYYGNFDAVDTFLSLGMDPASATAAHPYAVAMSKKNLGIAAILSSYWSGDEPNRMHLIYVPPTPVPDDLVKRNKGRLMANRKSMARMSTLSLVGL